MAVRRTTRMPCRSKRGGRGGQIGRAKLGSLSVKRKLDRHQELLFLSFLDGMEGARRSPRLPPADVARLPHALPPRRVFHKETKRTRQPIIATVFLPAHIRMSEMWGHDATLIETCNCGETCARAVRVRHDSGWSSTATPLHALLRFGLPKSAGPDSPLGPSCLPFYPSIALRVFLFCRFVTVSGESSISSGSTTVTE